VHFDGENKKQSMLACDGERGCNGPMEMAADNSWKDHIISSRERRLSVN
jgi:hypothetical protein